MGAVRPVYQGEAVLVSGERLVAPEEGEGILGVVTIWRVRMKWGRRYWDRFWFEQPCWMSEQEYADTVGLRHKVEWNNIF